MAGVYGDMLSTFPELLLDHMVFTMGVLPGGGFSQRTNLRVVKGYLSREVGEQASFADTTFIEGQKAKLYALDTVPNGAIRQGAYVEDSGELFKFVQDENFVREGGFSVYKLQIVTGATDRQVANLDVEWNIINAY